MKMLGRLGFGLTLLSLATVSSYADVPDNLISIRMGGAFPTSVNDFNESARPGLAGGVQYLRNVSERVAVGVQADFFCFPGKDHTIELPAGRLNADSDSTATTVELVGRYHLRRDGRFSPYFSAGLGVASFSQETNAAPMNGTTWADTSTRETRMVADDSSTGVAASAGVGLEMAVSSRWIAAIEANWHVFSVDNDEFGTDALNVPSTFLRIGYGF